MDKLSSTAEVLEVFHQPLEAIISLRRYIARYIHRTGGAHRTGGSRRVQAQVRACRDLLLDRDIGTNWLLGGGRRGRSGGEDEHKREHELGLGQHGLSPLCRP